MPVSGGPDDPVEIVAPGQLDRVAARVRRPSPEQVEAGNYRKAHVVVGGLRLTIETPLDGIRSGVSRDGKRWSVRMPAHYGYVKGSEGADGEQVDVYVGSEAHLVRRYPVWIVDQVDADTRKFDEHKVLLGFPDLETARRTYVAGFSDGRGRERAGALVRMTFDEFRKWLGSDTKKPLAYGRAAKAVHAAPLSASAFRRTPPDTDPLFHPGGSGYMPANVQVTADSPQSAGHLVSAIKSLLGLSAPGERAIVLQDAAIAANLELGKATDLLEVGDDHERPGRVEDLFDGPPDDRLRTVEAGGPEGAIPSGAVGVGRPQNASGEGAAPMEREYSRHAPQAGVQQATQELGRKLAGVVRVMKAFSAFGRAMSDRMSAIETALPAAEAVNAETIKAAVSAAVAKAIPAAVAVAVGKAIPGVVKAVAKAKAEDEKEDETDSESGEEDEEEGEEEDDEAEQEESGSGTDIEIVNENEAEDESEAESDEDETKKATRKAAAQQRLTAKALLRLAKADERESREATEEGRFAAGKRHHKRAMRRMAKARLHAGVAKSLRDGKVGPSMKAIEKSIGAVAKALKETKAKNQDKWPAGKAAATSAAVAAAPAAAQGTDLAKSIAAMTAAVEKANAGYALLTTNVQGLMAAVGGQSRDQTSDGTPPVAALFKAVPSSMEAQINALAADGKITARERDKGIDALGYLKVTGVPETVAKAAIDGCSPAVQAILRTAA